MVIQRIEIKQEICVERINEKDILDEIEREIYTTDGSANICRRYYTKRWKMEEIIKRSNR